MNSILVYPEKRLMIFILPIMLVFASCSKNDNNNNIAADIWDIEKDGIPKFVDDNYIDLSMIKMISKYRSAIGHDYSDFTEHCRSMKHYFKPSDNVSWSTVKIFCPVTGIITRVEQEWAGTKLEIVSDKYPAFRFQIFHITLANNRIVNEKIQAGDYIGTHFGPETYSDISVIVNDPTKQGRMVSWFDVLTDNLFDQYKARGVSSRSDIIISKATRDANPLTCSGDQFILPDPLEGWVILN